MTIITIRGGPFPDPPRSLLTKAVEGGWGLGRHAHTNPELVTAARARIAELQAGTSSP